MNSYLFAVLLLITLAFCYYGLFSTIRLLFERFDIWDAPVLTTLTASVLLVNLLLALNWSAFSAY